MAFDFKRIFWFNFNIFTFYKFFLNIDIVLLSLIYCFIIFDIKKNNILTNYQILLLIISTVIFYLIFNLFNLIFIYLNILALILVIISIFLRYFNIFIFILLIVLFFISLFNLSILDRNILYFVFIISFLNDTLAYLFGRILKGPKISKFISPNKTWSGTLISFSCILLILIYFDYSIFFSVLLSASLFFGDLYFSLIKRKFSIKDFSKLIPGHGGLLDRIDSMTFI